LQERFHMYLLYFKIRSRTARPKDKDELWSELVFTDYGNIIRTLDAFNPEEKLKFENTLWTEIKYILYRLPDKFVQYAFDNRPELFVDWDAARKHAFGLPVSEQEWEEFAQQARSSFGHDGDSTTEAVRKKQEEDDIEEDRENWVNEMYQIFRASENKLLFAKNLKNDYGLEIYEVVALLLDFCERIFACVSRDQGHCSVQVLSFVQDTNWCEIEEILDYVEELQNSTQWKKSYNGYELYEDAFYAHSETNEAAQYIICDTILYRAFLDVILEDWSSLGKKLAEGIPVKYAGYHIVWYTLPEWHIASMCRNLGKCHNIVPHLLNWLAEYEDSSFDERQNISIFETIVAYSQNAAEEVRDDPMQAEIFQKISNEFVDRINNITGKNYTLKRDLGKQ